MSPLTRIVNLSEEVYNSGMGAAVLAGDKGETETGGHSKVRDHGDGKDEGGEPGVRSFLAGE